MRKLLSIAFLLASVSVFGQGAQSAIVVKTSASTTVNALLYLPNDYNSTTNKYPVIFFFHGRGESAGSTGLSKIYNSSGAGGPAYFIAQGTWPTSFTNPRDGLPYKFIVVSPQAPGTNAAITSTQINFIMEDIYATYRVDTTRAYMMAISGGGQAMVEWLGRFSGARRHKIAAGSPQSAEIGSPSQSMINAYVADSTRLWGIGDAQGGDGLGTQTRVFCTGNFGGNGGSVTVPAGLGNFFTSYSGGHCCWNVRDNPTYRESKVPFYGGAAQNMNLYEYMLQFRQGGDASSGTNSPPTSNAGFDRSITLPTDTVNLLGSGNDPDGTISTYAWTQVSGTTAARVSPGSANTLITGMTTAGTRVFRLTVTDNGGASSSDDVTITTLSASNTAPTVNAGSDQAITLPLDSVTLNGAASDADGTISSRTWTKFSGGAATIVSASSLTTKITGLVAGTYVFRLTAVDDDGASSSDDVTVTVAASGGSITTKTINVNLYASTTYVDAAWNNWNVGSSLTSSTFNYATGGSSGVNAVLSAQTAVSDNGAGYPVTIVPVAVGRDASYHTATRTLTIQGLDNAKLYDISLFPSRLNNDGQVTTFTIGGSTVSVASFQNYANTGTFTSITPTANKIIVTIGQTLLYNYLNAVVITEKTGGTPTNQSPDANAGTDQTITLPTATASLTGSGTDPDGTIASYAWSQVSGTSATITSPSSASTTITGLSTSGVRVFRLTVTDNLGATDVDDVTVTVQSASNVLPVVNPTSPITVTLPGNTTTLNSNASDPDGTISTYAWTQTSGTTATITSPTSANTTITGLTTAGTRVFRVTVTDNSSGTSSANVTVNVIGSTGTRYIKEVGNGEYIKVYLLDNGTVRSTHWGGYLGVNRDTTAQHSVGGIVKVSGGQYRGMALDTLGKVYMIFKDNANGGREGTLLVDTTYTGAKFTGNTDVFGFYTAFLTLKNGQPWIWGTGDWLNLVTGASYNPATRSTYDSKIYTPRPLQLPPGGRTFVTLQPMEPINGPLPGILMGLANDGTVWMYNKPATGVTGGTPVQVTGLPSNIVTIGAISQFVYFAATTSQLWCWGGYTDMVGLALNTTTPANVTSTYTAVGMQFPLKKIASSWSYAQFLDNKNDLYSIGNNPHGAFGNGVQWPNWSTKTPVKFSWDFARTTLPTTAPVQTVGKFSNVWGEGTLSFESYVQDMGGKQLYAAGRGKANALADGIVYSNLDGRPEANNWSYYKKVDPLNVVWATGGGPVFDTLSTPKPQASAGIDQYGVTTSYTKLTGGGHQQGSPTIPTGSITARQWSQVSGPNTANILNPTSDTTTINGLVNGKYVMRMTVTSNVGSQIDSRDVEININQAAVNVPPVISAGPDQTITIPENGVIMGGSGTDADGAIVSYLWTKVSGGEAVINSPSSANTLITILSPGVYTFRLTGTDNFGATDFDEMTIVVFAAPPAQRTTIKFVRPIKIL